MGRKNKFVRPVVITLIVLGIGIPAGIFVINPEFFGEDIVTTKSNQQLIDEAIDTGLLEIPFECQTITECEEGQGIIGESMDTNPIEEIIDPKPDVKDADPIIEEVIMEDKMGMEEVIPVDPETLVTCDPPAELVNEQCLEPDFPLIEPPKVDLISKVIKTDNLGDKFESSVNLELQQLSFFVEDTTNLDFDNGFIENELFIVTDPFVAVTGTGLFDIKIANQTILTEQIPLRVSGMTDASGQIRITFTSPLGLASDLFQFRFQDNLDKFASIGITEIDYEISGFTVSVDNFEFSLADTKVFEMDIATDPNRILIVNEEGGTLRVFPIDESVTLCSSKANYCSKVCYVRSVRFGCQKYRKVCSPLPAPTVGAWKFFKFDQEGNQQLFDSGASFASACPLNIIVQRDEVYKIEVGSPTAGTVKWKSQVEQEKFGFQCVKQVDRTTGTLITQCNFRPQDNQAFINTLEIVP